MFRAMPTQVGDVLILSTARSFTVYAVGQVVEAGQQGFEARVQIEYVTNEAAARAWGEGVG